MKRWWLAVAVLVVVSLSSAARAGYLHAYALFDEAGNDLNDMFRAHTGEAAARVDLHGASGTYRVRLQPTTLTANRTLILPNANVDLGAIAAARLMTDPQTGTGVVTVHEHQLGRDPSQVWVETLGGAGGVGTQTCEFTLGAVSSTSIPVTAPAGCRYRLLAF